MVTHAATGPAGQDTLLVSWAALARLSAGARLTRTEAAVAAVFPQCSALSNAILLDPVTTDTASGAAADLVELYATAGVTSWALWLPTPVTDLDAPDEVHAVSGMTRDTTTLVMTLEVPCGLPSHPGVRRTPPATAGRAGDEPVPAADLPDPDGVAGLDAWVLVHDELAVVGAWSYLHGTDVGIYAVGTVPDRRRRGLARTLMLHVLADAHRRGARTASLQSTRLGRPLYASLGFRPTGRYEEWVPRRRSCEER